MQVLSIFLFFLGVHSLAVEQRSSCISPDVLALTRQVSDPHYFCAWYLNDGRTNSPIPNINVNALLTACECVVSAEPVGTNAATLNAIAKAARLQSFVSGSCSSTSGSPISKEFKSPASFCAFFNSYERHDSPIPNLNAPDVRHACKCVLESPKTSSQKPSTKPVSTPTKKSSSKLSSSSTKTPVSKTSSATTIKSSSKPVVKTSASSSKTTSSKTSKSSSSSISTSSKTSSKVSSSKLATSTKLSSSKTTSSSKSRSSTSSASSASRSSVSSRSSTSITKVPAIPSASSSSSSKTVDAYDVITSQGLQGFCSTYLGYTIPSVTATVTSYTSTTETDVSTAITTSIIFEVSTSTDVIETTTVIASNTAVQFTGKRALATPSALIPYAESAIDSGCSRAAVKPATKTFSSTVVSISTETIISTTTSTVYETDTSIATEKATSTVTTTVAAPSEAYCSNGNKVNGLAGSCGSGPCVTFNLRIEGATDTIYEGLITTGPMDITTPSGGTHLCDGTNYNANPNPAGTGITCLAAAGSLCDFDFDGTYSDSFQDFFISRIGSSMQTSNKYWGILNNGQFTPVGGCQTEPQEGDYLLWAYDAFNTETFLQVEPRNIAVAAGNSFTFTVTDSQSGQVVSGADFGGMTSGVNGEVTVSFPTAGSYRYKATRNSAIRSNGVVVTVV